MFFFLAALTLPLLLAASFQPTKSSGSDGDECQQTTESKETKTLSYIDRELIRRHLVFGGVTVPDGANSSKVMTYATEGAISEEGRLNLSQTYLISEKGVEIRDGRYKSLNDPRYFALSFLYGQLNSAAFIVLTREEISVLVEWAFLVSVFQKAFPPYRALNPSFNAVCRIFPYMKDALSCPLAGVSVGYLKQMVKFYKEMTANRRKKFDGLVEWAIDLWATDNLPYSPLLAGLSTFHTVQALPKEEISHPKNEESMPKNDTNPNKPMAVFEPTVDSSASLSNFPAELERDLGAGLISLAELAVPTGARCFKTMSRSSGNVILAGRLRLSTLYSFTATGVNPTKHSLDPRYLALSLLYKPELLSSLSPEQSKLLTQWSLLVAVFQKGFSENSRMYRYVSAICRIAIYVNDALLAVNPDERLELLQDMADVYEKMIQGHKTSIDRLSYWALELWKTDEALPSCPLIAEYLHPEETPAAEERPADDVAMSIMNKDMPEEEYPADLSYFDFPAENMTIPPLANVIPIAPKKREREEDNLIDLPRLKKPRTEENPPTTLEMTPAPQEDSNPPTYMDTLGRDSLYEDITDWLNTMD